jgi:tetratricopeptide (TPR) repeat protein
MAKERIVNRRPIPTLPIGLILTAALVAGCRQPIRRPEPGASTGLLNSGPTTKVTSRQAADVQFALGRSLEDADDPVQAEAAFRKAIENDPKRGDAHARLAVILCRKGAFEEASKEFAIALRRDPKNAEILCDQGYGFYLQRRWSEAESSFTQAIASDPRHARSHNNLGLVFARQGDGDRAVSEFLRAGADVSDAKANLGLILAMEDHLPEAQKAYAEALATKPNSTTAREGLRILTQAQAHRSSSIAAKSDRRSDGAVVRTALELPALPPR